MLNAMLSAPPELAWALASRIAWRNEPAPLSASLMTVNVVNSLRTSSDSRHAAAAVETGEPRIARDAPAELGARFGAPRRKCLAIISPALRSAPRARRESP